MYKFCENQYPDSLGSKDIYFQSGNFLQNVDQPRSDDLISRSLGRLKTKI